MYRCRFFHKWYTTGIRIKTVWKDLRMFPLSLKAQWNRWVILQVIQPKALFPFYFVFRLCWAVLSTTHICICFSRMTCTYLYIFGMTNIRKYALCWRKERLHQITKVEQWSKTIKRRWLNCLGHLMRMTLSTHARISLHEALRPSKRKRGKPQRTWLKVIEKDLKNYIQLIFVKEDPKITIAKLVNAKAFGQTIKHCWSNIWNLLITQKCLTVRPRPKTLLVQHFLHASSNVFELFQNTTHQKFCLFDANYACLIVWPPFQHFLSNVSFVLIIWNNLQHFTT